MKACNFELFGAIKLVVDAFNELSGCSGQKVTCQMKYVMCPGADEIHKFGLTLEHADKNSCADEPP